MSLALVFQYTFYTFTVLLGNLVALLCRRYQWGASHGTDWSWNKTPKELDALAVGFQACLAEGHSLRVGSPGWHLTLSTPGRDQVALQGWNLVPLGLVPPAVLLTPPSLKHWDVACCPLCPRVKLRARLGEIYLFWKVSLSQSFISTKGTRPNLPLLLLYPFRLQLTTLVLGAGNSVIRVLRFFWILKISCFYSCQKQSFSSPHPAAVLSCELIATPGQVSVSIVVPGTNNIDFQGKEGVFCISDLVLCFVCDNSLLSGKNAA